MQFPGRQGVAGYRADQVMPAIDDSLMNSGLDPDDHDGDPVRHAPMKAIASPSLRGAAHDVLGLRRAGERCTRGLTLSLVAET